MGSKKPQPLPPPSERPPADKPVSPPPPPAKRRSQPKPARIGVKVGNVNYENGRLTIAEIEIDGDVAALDLIGSLLDGLGETHENDQDR